MIDVGKMILAIRKERKMTQQQLAERLGTTKQTISNYERGEREPDYVTLEGIADILNVPMSMLISREDQQKALDAIYRGYEKTLIPRGTLQRRRVPILGDTAAGAPMTMQPIYDEYVDVIDDGHHYDAALRVAGDSMTPRYCKGDLVFVRFQDDVENGQTAVIRIGDDVTLKRIYHIPNGLQLLSENPAYPPMVYTTADDEEVGIRLIGLAVGVLHWDY